MSTNFKFYAIKMAELQLARTRTALQELDHALKSRSLRSQLEELISFVRECEARWESLHI
jgi:hypothetical protein